MPTPRTIAISLVSLVALGAVGLSGCAGSSGGDATSAPPATMTGGSSPSAGTASTSAAAAPTEQPGPVDASELTSRIQAAMEQLDTYTYTVTGSVTAQGVQSSSEGEFTVDRSNPDEIKVQGTMTTSEFGTVEMIQIGNTAYMRVDGTSTWTKDSAETGYTDISLDSTLGQAQSAEYVGDETVDGVDTRHYTLVVEDGDTADIYIDDQNRLIRMTGDSTATSTDMTFGDFNAPVTITAPDPSEIA